LKISTKNVKSDTSLCSSGLKVPNGQEPNSKVSFKKEIKFKSLFQNRNQIQIWARQVWRQNSEPRHKFPVWFEKKIVDIIR
jgi:hypothetical protein